MKKLLTIVIIMLLFSNCNNQLGNNKTGKNKEMIEGADFEVFFNKIPLVKLPIDIKCGFNSYVTDSFNNKQFRQFIPKNFEVVGKLESANNLKLIL